MPKEFITEKDIEDLFRRGASSLEIGDHTVLTQLAHEKAAKLGFRLVSGKPENPPSAPARPYLSQKQQVHPTSPEPCNCSAQPCCSSSAAAHAVPGDLRDRVRDAVVARLGSQVDANLLDVIIQRVLQSTGVK
jgi:hypothetical protein